MTARTPLAAALALAACLTGAAAPAEPPVTTIDSTGQGPDPGPAAESVSSDTETTTTFHGNVVVKGNDITLDCDFLKVISTRVGDKAATLGKYGRFRYLLATGHVRIVQGDRVATCGRAEVFPGEDRIVLTEDPVVAIASEGYRVSGPRMVLYRGQRRAVVEGRSHVELPAIKDLGFPSASPAQKP
jgi:lipopolysaccharide export system protein LptA